TSTKQLYSSTTSNKILFVRTQGWDGSVYQNKEIYSINSNGSGESAITNSSYDYETNPAWSPNKTKIAFVSDKDGNSEIYVKDLISGVLTRLTNNPAIDRNPTWSPDGTKIAFDTNRDGNYEIYVMNSDGSSQINFVNRPTTQDRSPNWSPNGLEIVFSSYSSNSFSSNIYKKSLSGTTVNSLTTDSSNNDNPKYSPDGTKIIFTKSSTGDIYTMNANGSSQTNLTSTSGTSEIEPAWSPDGTEIIYVTGTNFNQLWIMNTNGSNKHSILSDSYEIRSPAWASQ
ncbi:MAG: hypothetical protein AABY03_00710, partial [Nanoarchaeota archaeon]